MIAPFDAAVLDRIAEFITDTYGSRCAGKDTDDFPELGTDPGARCPICSAWEHYDSLATWLGEYHSSPRPGVLPEKHGARWIHHDYAAMVGAIREGCSLAEIAERAQRTERGIRTRLKWLLPPTTTWPISSDHALDLLKIELADPKYDWQRNVEINEQVRSRIQGQRPGQSHSHAHDYG